MISSKNVQDFDHDLHDDVVKMMVEVLNMLSIATKQVGFPYASIGIGTTDHWSEKYLEMLLGQTE